MNRHGQEEDGKSHDKDDHGAIRCPWQPRCVPQEDEADGKHNAGNSIGCHSKEVRDTGADLLGPLSEQGDGDAEDDRRCGAYCAEGDGTQQSFLGGRHL